MSAAAATADAGKPAKKGKKKLIIIIVVALVVLLGGGAAAMVMMKKKAAVGEDGEEAAPAASAHKSEKHDPKHPPTFVPLDPFVVNLADKGSDRYAQIGITLEVADEHYGEEMKAFMPAIRNGILMILAHKSSTELLDRAGKEKLAGQIQRDAGRTMGADIEEPDDDDDAAAADDSAEKKAVKESAEAPKAKKKKKKKKRHDEENPIKSVLFSNFIIQ